MGALLGVLGTGMVRRRQAAEFRALSSQALAASNEQFLQLALTRFGALEDATEREARARERATLLGGSVDITVNRGRARALAQLPTAT